MRHVLVVANERSELLAEAVRDRAGPGAEVLVVAPALNSRLRHCVSDDDEARRRAAALLARCLVQLSAAGLDARGAVGDADPYQAIADALHGFAADEIVLATQPEEQANRLARRLATRLRARYPAPLVHIVVDRARGEERVVPWPLPAAA
jgi:hypothetical protein